MLANSGTVLFIPMKISSLVFYGCTLQLELKASYSCRLVRAFESDRYCRLPLWIQMVWEKLRCNDCILLFRSLGLVDVIVAFLYRAFKTKVGALVDSVDKILHGEVGERISLIQVASIKVDLRNSSVVIFALLAGLDVPLKKNHKSRDVFSCAEWQTVERAASRVVKGRKIHFLYEFRVEGEVGRIINELAYLTKDILLYDSNTGN